MIVFRNCTPRPLFWLRCDASLRRRERHEICNTFSCSSPYQTIGQLSRKVCQRSYIRPSVSQFPPQSLSPLAWPLHASRTFSGHLRAAFVVGPGQQTLPRCCGRSESNCSSLHVLCRFGNSSGVGGCTRMLYASCFTFSTLLLLAKIQ